MERIAGDYLSEKLNFFLVCTRTVQRCLIAIPTQSVKSSKIKTVLPSLKKKLNFGRGNLKTEDIEQEIVSARWGMKDEGGPVKSRNKETRHILTDKTDCLFPVGGQQQQQQQHSTGMLHEMKFIQ